MGEADKGELISSEGSEIEAEAEYRAAVCWSLYGELELEAVAETDKESGASDEEEDEEAPLGCPSA